MIVAGFGFRAAAGVASLQNALAHAKGAALTITRFATASDKTQADCFVAFAAANAVQVCAIDAAALAQQTTVTQSDASKAARGVGSLCEAAALAAAGPGAKLIRSRVLSDDGMATCALAEGKAP